MAGLAPGWSPATGGEYLASPLPTAVPACPLPNGLPRAKRGSDGLTTSWPTSCPTSSPLPKGITSPIAPTFSQTSGRGFGSRRSPRSDLHVLDLVFLHHLAGQLCACADTRVAAVPLGAIPNVARQCPLGRHGLIGIVHRLHARNQELPASREMATN